MSHVHDLEDLEVEVIWSNEAGVVAIANADGTESFVEDGEWYLGIDVGVSCCLEVPMSRILELLEEAKKSKYRRAVHMPTESGLKGGRCCRADPVEPSTKKLTEDEAADE